MLRRNFFSSTKSRSCISTCSTASTIISSVSSSFRFAAASSSATTPSITTKQDIDLYKKKAHALFMLRNTPQLALSSEAAIRLITDDRQSNKTIPETEIMTRDEAKQFLRDCHDAGIVVISPSPTSTSSSSPSSTTLKQLVITEPNAVFSAYRNSDKLDFVTSAVDLQEMCQTNRSYEYHQQAKPHLLQKGTAAVLAAAPDEVAAAAKRAHSRFWAWIAFGMSCQMLLFAYWTFLVYDWDTMEPFTYFVGCGYMLAFFAYFVRTRRGHTFGEMDRLVLSSVVKNRMVVRKNVKSL